MKNEQWHDFLWGSNGYFNAWLSWCNPSAFFPGTHISDNIPMWSWVNACYGAWHTCWAIGKYNLNPESFELVFPPFFLLYVTSCRCLYSLNWQMYFENGSMNLKGERDQNIPKEVWCTHTARSTIALPYFCLKQGSYNWLIWLKLPLHWFFAEAV